MHDTRPRDPSTILVSLLMLMLVLVLVLVLSVFLALILAGWSSPLAGQLCRPGMDGVRYSTSSRRTSNPKALYSTVAAASSWSADRAQILGQSCHGRSRTLTVLPPHPACMTSVAGGESWGPDRKHVEARRDATQAKSMSASAGRRIAARRCLAPAVLGPRVSTPDSREIQGHKRANAIAPAHALRDPKASAPAGDGSGFCSSSE